jgi:MOSC domain-containing protein YiiM
MSGKLEAIWLKRGKGALMDECDRATLIAGRGILHNANQGGKRQVTIISQERWQELVQELGANLPPQTRRANLMVSGIDLSDSRGRILTIGACRLLIHGETRPCEQMEAAWPGLQAAMRVRWGGGAFAEILEGGEIRVGEAAAWQDD